MSDELKIGPNSSPQKAFFEASDYEVLYGGASYGGKLLRLDTPVPTPMGWTTMGDLQAGDSIFDEMGKVTTVLIAHPVTTPPDCYRVTFDDGSTIDACSEHLWRTLTLKDLSALSRRTPEFRAKRRLTRQSRRGGLKSETFSEAISLRNSTHPPPALPAPRGEIRTTREIANTLIGRRGRRNHYIPLAGALDLPERDLRLDPYLLGLWLGNGASRAGRLTTQDVATVLAFQLRGFPTRHYGRYDYGIRGLVTVLRLVGVFGDKHVPQEYLRASRSQRLALLQGLMDSDGTAWGSGRVEFSSKRIELAEAVLELARSLGHKPSLTQKRAKLRGIDYGIAYRVSWTPPEPVFRVERKLNRQRIPMRRGRSQFRSVVSCDRIDPVPMRCITVSNSSGMYLVGRSMIPTHNSWALVVDPLRYREVPDMTGLIFRRTFPELERAILPLTYKIYPHFGAEYHVQSKTWTFPCGPYVGRTGMTIKLGYMQFADSWTDYKGGSYTYQGFDELTGFEEIQWTMMRPWNRTNCAVAPYRRATTNPGDVGHAWVRKYFVDTCPPVLDGDLRWSEEAKIWWQPMAPGPTYYWRDPDDPTRTLTRKFIPARIFDNVDGMRADPEYLTKLLALPTEKRRALLEGDWNVFEGQFFKELREEYHKIRPVKPLPGWPILGAIDYGNPSVFELAFIDYDGNIVFYDESYMLDVTPEERAHALADLLLERKVGPIDVLYDTDMATNLKYYAPTEHAPIEVFQAVLMERLSENMPNLEPVSKEPKRQWRMTSNETVRNLLHWTVQPGGKRRGPKLFITDDCPYLWESITSLVHDPLTQKGLDYKQARANDHPYDALKTIVMRMSKPHEVNVDRSWQKVFGMGVPEPKRWEAGMG